MKPRKRTRYSVDSRLGDSRSDFLSSPIIFTNANNAAVSLPVEIIHAIFFIFQDSYGRNPIRIEIGPRYPPIWIAITYVCHRWRVVALDFRKLWSTITPDLSPKWLAAFLNRSSYTPRHVCLRVGPSPKKPRKRKRSSTRRRPVKRPLITLPNEVTEEVLSHVSRIESLHLKGNTADVIRTLTFLGPDGSMPLISLRVDPWDELEYRHVEFGDDDERQDTSLILPDTLFGGGAAQLRRLYCCSGMHITFPQWVLGNISEFTVTLFFCPRRLFSALRQMPQLEVLRVSPIQRYFSLLHSDWITVPVNLNKLTLLVIEDTFLELSIAVLDYISMPANVRKHLKLTLDEPTFSSYPWERFATLMREKTTGSHHPLYGVHFRREPSSTSVCLWASTTEPGVAPSPWPPLDDPFRLDIRIVDYSCLHGVHTSCYISSFHRLQEICVFLGGQTIQELFVEYGTSPHRRRSPMIHYRCWRTLFSGFSSLKTLHFGDGAASLLANAWYVATSPQSQNTTGAAASRSCPFGNLQRLIVSRSTFTTLALWRWIHYSFARPAEWEVSDLRTDVEALLSDACWGSAVGLVEDVVESLLMFLLYCRRQDIQVFEVLLVKSLVFPQGLHLLQRLLHMLDPDWNVIPEAVSRLASLTSLV
ncbi:hypothetical protein BC827DRAFT_1243888 [Russula dissimulans]|nr:hypothetical protein BC827DRAFT_1243888 [Russula dissimulans]